MSASSFDRGHFEETLERVGELLGELWAIDEMVRWVEANPEGGYGEEANGLYPRITVGETHPFEFEAPEGTWRPLLISGRNWGGQVVESVRSLTWDIVRTESAPFEEAVVAIRGSVVEDIRNGVPDDFAEIDNNLSAWNGDAADAFGDWYAKVEFIARRQAYVAECVCAGIAASKAVVDLGQQSLQNVVDEMVATLDEQLAGRQAKNGLPPDNSAFVALVVGAALIGALAAIPTGGASVGATAALAATASATSELLSVAADTLPAEEGVERTASLSTAEEIFHELSGAVEEVTDNVRRKWQGVESTVAELRANANSAADDGLLSPTRPTIVRRDPTPDGFHHESAPR